MTRNIKKDITQIPAMMVRVLLTLLVLVLMGGNAAAQVVVDGSVFGGGNDADVMINTTVNINTSTGQVKGNVYGGGNKGDVGNITKNTTDYNYRWSNQDSGDNTPHNNTITTTNRNTGICTVTITDGIIGVDGTLSPDHGNVFGGGKGEATSFWCQKGMAFSTNVSVSKGTFYGNVYGGGQVGRVEDDTKVTIGTPSGTDEFEIKGSVFGAGAGVATHGYSALVRGNSDVTIQGKAKVTGSVYGGGETASVGRFTVVNSLPKEPLSGGTCTVTIQDNAKIGTGGSGEVYGACKGVEPDYTHNSGHWMNDNQSHDFTSEAEYNSFLKTLALTSNTLITINGSASINGSVFGGGQRGITLGNVEVNVIGGTVASDVYGGGALADTNTGNWNDDNYVAADSPTSVDGLYEKSGNVYTLTSDTEVNSSKTYYTKVPTWTNSTSKSALYTTHVNILGGSMRDVFGGGLGRKSDATNNITAVEATVYGDVRVNLNGLKFASTTSTSTKSDINATTLVSLIGDDKPLEPISSGGTEYQVKETKTGAVVTRRVFGANNTNGSPQGKVEVYVFKTEGVAPNVRSDDKDNTTYDLAAVFGGGNQAAYIAADQTAKVFIETCNVSINEVYGGGYGADVPNTHVEVKGAYEIGTVFGGGYGAGSDDPTAADYNPGANVTNTAEVILRGGTIHEVYGGSNTKGDIINGTTVNVSDENTTCHLKVDKVYGAGKNASMSGDVNIVMGCQPNQLIEEIYAGSKRADVDGNVNLTITSGKFGRVFGGNKYSGALKGSITVNIEETGNCDVPIIIGELYAGGNLADYSVYGYDATGKAIESGTTPLYNEPKLNIRSFTSIGKIFGGGYKALMVANPTVNINVVRGSHYNDNDLAKETKTIQFKNDNGVVEETVSLTYPAHKKGAIGTIGDVFGGGNLAKIIGNTTVNVGTETTVDFITEPVHLNDGNSLDDKDTDYIYHSDTKKFEVKVEGANITGNVYGGGNQADITGNTQVNICAKYNSTTAKWESVSYATGLAGVTIGSAGVNDKDHGNVFGGGKGIEDSFTCEKAMVGVDGDGETNPDGGTAVNIYNGTVFGNVYGGGEIGRVEKNTVVTIGTGDGVAPGGTPTSAPEIKGSVFGGGKGKETHGYAALVRGNPTVVIQGNAKVGHNVYGGGEIASVARYKVAKTNEEAAANGVEVDMPYVLANNTSGKCIVKVLGYAEIGPDDMKMYHDNIAVDQDKPDDWGHVFGAGKGIMPDGDYDYVNGVTKRMISVKDAQGNIIGSDWEYFANEAAYITFIQTLALASKTDVTIGDHAFVKGSVYGGSENGLVQFDTDVKIQDDCQIGNGDGVNRRYTADEWAYDGSTDAKSLKECAHWDYGREEGTGENKKIVYAPYDPNANATGNLDNYSNGRLTEGGRRIATDGHTFYGNVFGGGSGSVPYFDAEEGISKYLNSAGTVKRNTKVTISGGHILTNVYGGCEATNVLGKATVIMTGGSIGVPRTEDQIKKHPVTCYLFGAGKGDQRIFFNKDTNVENVEVEVSGGRIYGSVFGGGEDGHVMKDVLLTIKETDETNHPTKIGTRGTSYVDGNIFGGGRGFGGDALTAGNIGGSVTVNIEGGEMLGSIYGGGRLASVGYGLYLTTEDGYGVMRPDNVDDKGNSVSNFKRGYITVNINGGTIGNDEVDAKYGGNVFGGSMGRLTKLDGTPFAADHWPLLATAKSTTVNINGGTIKRSVYGGGEMGTVTTDAIVNVSGGTIGTLGNGGAEFGNVYGGGKGYVDDAGTYATAGIIKGNTKVTINSGTNGEPKIYHNIYGGGAYGSVGTITYGNATYIPNQTAAVSNMPTVWERAAEGTTQVNTGTAEVYVYGGTIGTNGNENGMVFGSSRGDVGTPVNGIDPNNRLAWVYNTKVVIGGEGKSPIMYGSVYGSGENGHVFENTQVDIHSGTMGVTTDDSFGGPNYRLRGNVYGGGCGEDTYPGTTGTTKENFNPLAGIVLGTTNVMIDGGQVVHNVYGAGALGSATNTSVTIAGNAVIGVSGKNGGNVFGAARGKEGITIVGSNLANSIETAVNISGGQIWGSVYGGGETGNVKQDVNVSMTGGAVAKDVYGGGALAHTQTANWDMTNSTWADATNTSAKYKTNVTVSGGTMRDVYGGGLGRVRVAAVAAQGTEGDPDYVPAVAEVTPIEAKVYGDVTVKLNEGVATDDKGAIVNRVFAANNLNGSPQGNTSVYVYATQSADAGHATIGSKFAKHTGLEAEGATSTYDVQAVYGGGNEAAYIPVSPYTAENATGAKSQVIIEGCDLTSIKTVYGGGNAASVPETNVTVKSVYEIEDLFGGGNGKDDTSYGKNPGADIGVYKNASNEDVLYGTGNVNATTQGGYIHEIFGASNQKGNIKGDVALNMTQVGDCTLKIDKVYNAGRNADIEGNLISVLSCQPSTKIQEYYGGAENANVKGNVELTITNGWFEKVFAGNNQSGAILGHIKLNVEETGCSPIRIDELYGCGNDAAYSIYGYYVQTEETEAGTGYGDVGETPLIINEKLMLLPRTSADDPHKPVKTFNHEAQTWTVYAGGNSDPYPLYDNPEVNIVSATYIGKVFGGGYGAHGTVYGDPHVNINMIKGDWAGKTYGTISVPNQLGEIGVVYGGGNEADVVGNTFVNVGTVDKVKLHLSWDNTAYTWSDEKTVEGANITGNVFGGGKGIADSFECAKAMVGVDNESDDPNNRDGGTHVIIGNGTVKGNVYGGGEIGRVERNTEVTIGLGDGVEGGAKTPVIEGNVFGAGSGLKTHGYSALVRGNSTVTVQGNAWVQKSIYGGGETATVGKYALNDAGLPTAPVRGGLCTVTVKGYAEVGPDGMQMKKAGGPDDTGYVFGACKGILPYAGYADSEQPQHMDGDRQQNGTWIDHPKAYKAFNELTLDNNNVLEVDNAYMTFINTLALATTTEVTIGGHAFIKGSVYGGSENGHVQGNTHVTIDGDCQIGNGDGVNRRYTAAEWAYDGSSDAKSLKECASWDYGKKIGTDANGKDIMEYQPYDVYKDSDSDGTPDYASDGHTFYGNVFGGGSGYFSYHRNHPTALTALKAKDAGYADGLWHREAGSVGGNTVVDIKGGHILTSVYGGNECTDVTGTTTINMSGGTLGVPRTVAQIKAHPVTCYLFGAGKGDQRINFNTWTNVEKAIVNITGGHIFGSVFGGGEDGHVLGDVEMKISGDNTVIGTTGTSYVDGNIFGGGRGFSGDAQTAGTVGGNIILNISGGTMLGNVYGGGRLASVGTLFTAPEDPNYGNFVEDAGGKTYGHVAVNISGGIIGNTVGNAESGNVFGGSMGRLTLLDGTTINPIWPKMAQVKETNVTISGNAVIKRTVYGGGELGTVRDNATVNINGGTVYRDVYGAGYGSKDYETKTKIEVKVPKEGVTNPTSASDYDDVSYVFTPMIFAGCVGQNTYVNIAGGQVKKSVYGGGEMASVGIMDCRVKIDNNATDPVYTEGTDKYVYEHFHSHLDENNGFALSWPFHFENAPGYFGATHVNITGGRIGLNGEDNKEENNPFEDLDNGDVYGGGKGIAGEYKNYVYCANVGSAEVTIAYPAGNTATPSNYMESNFIECIAGAVYGGAENGHVMGDTKLTLKNGLIGHSMYGGGSGKGKFSTTLLKIGSTSEHYTRDIYSFTAGKVFGNSTVEMSGGTVVRNVYGGGNMGSVGKGNYAGGADDYSTSGYGETLTGNLWDNANDYSKAFLGSGKCIVNITGGTVGYIDESDPSNSMYPWNSTASLPYGNVFGGCRGESAPNIVETPRYLYSPEFFVGYANETAVTIGKTDGSGPTILGSVYGGGMDGHIRRDASVTILGGEIGIPFTEANKTKVKTSDPNNLQWLARGNVYGSGSGIGKYKYDFDYDGKYESTVKYNNGRATVDTKEEDYSTSAGSVTRFTTVDIKGGTIHRNVYGGGSLSSIGAPKIGQSYDPYHPSDSEHSSEVGKQSLNKVTISGGQIGDADCLTSGYGGEVNGGSRGAMAFENSLANPASFANSVYTDVIISGEANILGNVFGGGEAGIVKHDTEVKMQGGTVGNDLYGGGDLADVGGNTVVDMTGGTIKHDAFGGARGTADVAAEVKGNATVTLDGTKFIPAFDTNGILTGGRIFGANNVNGTPKGHVKVHVLQTVDSAKDPSVALADRTTYDVGAVYGGGNNADYKPTSTTEYAEVIIDGCEKTSIKYVFGGGNAAATPANEVMINGSYIIDNVFGGGNGTVSPANVGYNETNYKTMGTAKTNLSGGYIHNVYGGSNNQGNILGGASVTNEKHTGEGCCDNLQIQEIYGGGKQADMFGGAEIVLGCMPNDWIGAIYAGAENADVGSDVSLTLTSGKFERVFGGNKSGGRLNGGIELNIEENPGCSTPIIIGELYGGGNEAPYSIYGYKDEKDSNGKWIPREKSDYDALTDDEKAAEGILSGPHHNPVVNVKAFTSIGNIFGGGYGRTAVMVGNPIVNINEVAGGREYTGETRTLDDGTKITLYERKADGKMGVVGTVFGGGNAAEVKGNPNVNIGTAAEVGFESLRTSEGVPKKPVLGADIRGNVYGGGNNAAVTGDPKVVIGQKKD